MVTNTPDKLTLLGMEVRNSLGIRFAAFTLPEGVTRVGGLNGAGKTSLRTSAIECLGGARYFPEEPVRRGEAKAQIVMRFNRFVVERTIQPDRSTEYVLTTPDGKPFPGGSLKMLEGFREALAFDPFAFARLQPREQADLLKKMVGLDFTDLDRRRAQLQQERDAAGRDRKGRETQLLAMVTYPHAPAEEILPEQVDAGKLAAELEAANAQNEKVRQAHEHVRVQTEIMSAIAAKILNGRKQIEAWKKQLALMEDEQAENEKMMETYRKNADGLAEIDTGPILVKMRQIDATNRANVEKANETNRMVRANKAHAAAKATYEAAAETYRTLDRAVAEIDRQKAERLAAVKLPVDGLGFSESGVTFNGIPFEQVNDAAKIEVSTAIGLARHPEFPHAWIQDGSLLDKNTLAAIARVVERAGGKVLIEVVTDNPANCEIFIEDGEVKGGVQTETERKAMLARSEFAAKVLAEAAGDEPEEAPEEV